MLFNINYKKHNKKFPTIPPVLIPTTLIIYNKQIKNDVIKLSYIQQHNNLLL